MEDHRLISDLAAGVEVTLEFCDRKCSDTYYLIHNILIIKELTRYHDLFRPMLRHKLGNGWDDDKKMVNGTIFLKKNADPTRVNVKVHLPAVFDFPSKVPKGDTEIDEEHNHVMSMNDAIRLIRGHLTKDFADMMTLNV